MGALPRSEHWIRLNRVSLQFFRAHGDHLSGSSRICPNSIPRRSQGFPGRRNNLVVHPTGLCASQIFRESTRGARDLSRRNVRGRQGADNTSQRPAHDRPCGLKSALPSRSARSPAILAASSAPESPAGMPAVPVHQKNLRCPLPRRAAGSRVDHQRRWRNQLVQLAHRFCPASDRQPQRACAVATGRYRRAPGG